MVATSVLNCLLFIVIPIFFLPQDTPSTAHKKNIQEVVSSVYDVFWRHKHEL